MNPKGWSKGNRAVARAYKQVRGTCSHADAYKPTQEIFMREAKCDAEIIHEALAWYFQCSFDFVPNEMEENEAEASKVIEDAQ
jgi:hypothetical protein